MGEVEGTAAGDKKAITMCSDCNMKKEVEGDLRREEDTEAEACVLVPHLFE